MKPEVLYCDNHVVVVAKPAGLATQCDQSNSISLTTWARSWLKTKFSKPFCAFAEPIHRLDKDVSGLVVFAKTGKGLARLVGQVREGHFRKVYYALVQGAIPRSNGVLENWLVRGSFSTQVADSKRGRWAQLEFGVIDAQKGQTLLEIWPQTGRYHQIRAQLAHCGFPILGDVKYGAETIEDELERCIYLHHGQCAISHPIGGRQLLWRIAPGVHWPTWARAAIASSSIPAPR